MIDQVCIKVDQNVAQLMPSAMVSGRCGGVRLQPVHGDAGYHPGGGVTESQLDANVGVFPSTPIEGGGQGDQAKTDDQSCQFCFHVTAPSTPHPRCFLSVPGNLKALHALRRYLEYCRSYEQSGRPLLFCQVVSYQASSCAHIWRAGTFCE